MCANITNTKTTTKTRKVLVKRVCRFMVDADIAARLLEDAGRAPFGVYCEFSDGEKTADFYWLQPVVGGWRVIKEGPGGEPDGEYLVDDSFGPCPEEHWTCECKGYRFQSRRQPQKPCRHIGAVAALLRRLGYDLPKPAAAEAKTA